MRRVLGKLILLPLILWMALLDTFDISFCALAIVLAGLTYAALGYGAYQVVV